MLLYPTRLATVGSGALAADIPGEPDEAAQCCEQRFAVKPQFGTSHIKRPDFHQLSVFVAVAEARSFAEAARIMRRTQPAVSQAIARLEETYGGDLFERRRGARLALTPIGEAILPSARILLDTVDEQMTRAVAAAQSRAGHLTLGFSSSLAVGRLRSGIAAFSVSNPDVRLRMVEAHPGELYRRLNERQVDLMIAAPLPELNSMTLEQERLWDEKLLVALPARHELAGKDALTWQEVGLLQLILRESETELAAYRGLLDSVDRPGGREQHAVPLQTLLDMVGIGMGATILFESGAVPHRDVVFRPIAEDGMTVPIVAIYPKSDANPIRHRLLKLIRDQSDDPENYLIPHSAKAAARDRG